MSELAQYPKTITWYINEHCNFHCSYCLIEELNKESLVPIDLDLLSQSLDYLGSGWTFIITGGEPFMEKNFIEICRIINQKHKLGGILTNLTLTNVDVFVDSITPDMCTFIDASIHIQEREKKDKGLTRFIEKVCLLQSRGFDIFVSYVAHPCLINRIEKDIAYLKSSGIKKIFVKSLGGWQTGKYYPDAYTKKEKAFLLNMPLSTVEKRVLQSKLNYQGRLCTAGHTFFTMDRSGNMKKCSSSTEERGNLFKKNIVFDKEPVACSTSQYFCIHDCIYRSLPGRNEKRNSIYGLLSTLKKGVGLQ